MIISNILEAFYQHFWCAVVLSVLIMFFYLYSKEHGKKEAVRIWIAEFKKSSLFRRLFLLMFYTAMIFLRTLLNRKLWANPLSEIMDGWWLWEETNGEMTLTTESLENMMLFIPFMVLLLWAIRSNRKPTILKDMKLTTVLWQSVKITFIFSFTIEFLQLILRLGTWQLSDMFYNTLGGFIGGLIYWICYRVKHREKRNQMKDEKKVLPELQDVKFLLKFGKKEHIEQFIGGSLFCSNAETFWGIEDNNKIRGQGDHLEASAVIYSQETRAYDYETGELSFELPMNAKLVARIEPAKHMPVFCMFAVRDDECDGKNIKLSTESKDTIKDHFPNADTVAIIRNPSKFVEDVVGTIGTRAKYDCVHYHYIDDGIPVENGTTRIDMEYFKYLMQDTPPVKEENKKTYRLIADYAFRVLLCKDIFFQGEKEFRIVLPDEKIASGTAYLVQLTEEIQTMSLDDFLATETVRI